MIGLQSLDMGTRVNSRAGAIACHWDGLQALRTAAAPAASSMHSMRSRAPASQPASVLTVPAFSN